VSYRPYTNHYDHWNDLKVTQQNQFLNPNNPITQLISETKSKKSKRKRNKNVKSKLNNTNLDTNHTQGITLNLDSTQNSSTQMLDLGIPTSVANVTRDGVTTTVSNVKINNKVKINNNNNNHYSKLSNQNQCNHKSNQQKVNIKDKDILNTIIPKKE